MIHLPLVNNLWVAVIGSICGICSEASVRRQSRFVEFIRTDLISAVTQHTWDLYTSWEARFNQAAADRSLTVLAAKTFKPKVQGIPVLPNYTVSPDESFWDSFPVNLVQTAASLIDRGALLAVVADIGVTDRGRLDKVLDDLLHGADIGCVGPARAASISGNAPDAAGNGPQVTDAVAAWAIAKYVFGPVDEGDVPAHAKVSGIMTRQKPNGAVRVIINLSAPLGNSVNDGIDTDAFTATMSSTAAWLDVLDRVGRGGWMIKVDWSDAYKHIAVRAQDADLQWFCWLGKYFREQCLVFGAASSAGIFDRHAKVLLDLALRKSGFDARLVCQHLDDVVAAAADSDKSELTHFDRIYAQIAAEIGVKLAPRDDPDKSFSASRTGVIFGVHYDLGDMTWSLPPEKLGSLVNSLIQAADAGHCAVSELRSIVGKIVNIKPLFAVGKYNVDALVKTNARVVDQKRGTVQLDNSTRRQMHFWSILVKAVAGRTQIPMPPGPLPPWALEAFTDAAGGTTESTGRGCGGIVGPWWFYCPWSWAINSGAAKVEGKKVGRKLAALELVGPLITLAVGHKFLRGGAIKFWVDNAGSVAIWRKGYCNSCSLCNTIVKAMATIAAALGVMVDVTKIRRCSNTGAVVADMISKGELLRACQTAEAHGQPLQQEPARITGPLLAWLQCPIVNDDLGPEILRHIAQQTEVLGYSRRVR